MIQFQKKDLLMLILINICTILILLVFFNVDSTILQYPIRYDGDAIAILQIFKMIQTGDFPVFGIPVSDAIGAPFGYNGGDYPLPILFQILYIKVLSWFFNDTVLLFNTFIILSYLLASSMMYIVLRKFQIDSIISFTISILYTFIPFHIYRIPHTLFINYYYIPLLIFLIIRLYDKIPLFYKPNSEVNVRLDLSIRNIGIAVIVVIFSSWNFYYTFFLSYLVIIAGASSYLYHRTRCHIISSVILLSLMIVPFFINMLPYLYHDYQHGKNYAVEIRSPAEAEVYGLKISQMLLPVDHHRIGSLRSIKERTYSNPLVNENATSTLGLIASAGFIILILSFISLKSLPNVLRKLAILNLFAVLLGTIGGFSSIFATIVSPQIRGYNRISIIIAALSLIAVAYLLNQIFANKPKVQIAIISTAILFIGLYDQVTPNMSLKPAPLAIEKFDSDKDFIRKVEAKLDYVDSPTLLQLPYVAFPGGGTFVNMGDYAQMVNYLHSDKLTWTYGAVRGRESDRWLTELTSKPIEEIVTILKNSGFNGIVVNRDGYEDHGEELYSTLIRILNDRPIESIDGKQYFFKVNPISDDVDMNFTLYNYGEK